MSAIPPATAKPLVEFALGRLEDVQVVEVIVGTEEDDGTRDVFRAFVGTEEFIEKVGTIINRITGRDDDYTALGRIGIQDSKGAGP